MVIFIFKSVLETELHYCLPAGLSRGSEMRNVMFLYVVAIWLLLRMREF